jgi:hypothetical protein
MAAAAMVHIRAAGGAQALLLGAEQRGDRKLVVDKVGIIIFN